VSLRNVQKQLRHWFLTRQLRRAVISQTAAPQPKWNYLILTFLPFDQIYYDNNGNSDGTTFENLKNIYVCTGFKRNDDVLMGYHYYAYNYHWDAVELKKDSNDKLNKTKGGLHAILLII
jgi:hypothetical protein